MLVYSLCSLTIHLHSRDIINHTVQAVVLSPHCAGPSWGRQSDGTNSSVSVIRENEDVINADIVLYKSLHGTERQQSEQDRTSSY